MKLDVLLIVSYIFSYGINSVFPKPVIRGRYTRNIKDYQIIIPRKLNHDGTFQTFNIPSFFKYNLQTSRQKRSELKRINYGITLNGIHHHLKLWPNHNFLAPDAAFERRDPRSKVQSRKIRRKTELCHYTGSVRNHPNSRAALSTCDGLAGYVVVDDVRYFIEPLHEHIPNQEGQHAHLIYKKSYHNSFVPCGTTGSWEKAWKDRLLNKYLQGSGKEVKRGLHSIHRYLETLVVADKKFLEFHKNTDVETYVLTIMNMVSDFYHDASTGNQMDVVVVRIIYLEKEEEEVDLTLNANADDSLASFCKWQQTVNPQDIHNPNHHDIAVLLTRYDICSDNMANCGLMGLAYVAAACTGDKPCAINEDAGLILAIVVAHEMGHVMGCSHDKEDESGCTPQAADQSYHVMSPYVHFDTTIWSTCSRTFITTFFDNDLGECLNDEPQETQYKGNEMLPGSTYDADYQCRITFPGSTSCGGDPEKFCEMLMCKTNPDSCMSDGEPPADGTKCAENKWCYNKKCVEIGERPEAVNGGWGQWGQSSECSRTCGAGVSAMERECNNPVPQHKGRYCLGERRKVKICNTQPCEEGSKSFRAVQCTEFNSVPFQDKLFEWTPYLQEDDPCALHCLNQENVFVKLAPRVKDGTKCKRGTHNMCISGSCMKIGCDFVIDSDAAEDVCGVCKGDGTQCKIIDEVYTGTGHNYVKVATIPEGSRNILIEELRPSINTISISSLDNQTYFLNGDFTEQQDQNYDFGGTEGVYSHPQKDQEMVVIHGPIKKGILFYVVFYNQENVGYHYRYAELTADTGYQPKYHWEFVEWEQCDARCGGGSQTANPECVEETKGKVTLQFCQGLEKPKMKMEKCNEQPCKTKWRVGKWGNCTACRFQSGMRAREVECVRESQKSGEEDVLVDDNQCGADKPGARELCNSHKKCAKTKRQIGDLPVEIMQQLWYEMLADDVTHMERFRKEDCQAKHDNTTPKLAIGTVIHDRVPPEEIKLIEVPLKQSHSSINLTDEAFETMGDKVPDSLDFQKEKIHKSKEATELKTALKQHENGTKRPEKE